MRYEFTTIELCNMCHAGPSFHKVMGRRLSGSQGKNPRRKMGITTTVVQCTNCGLIFSNPQPLPVDLQEHYSVPPEDYWTEAYLRQEAMYESNEKLKIEKVLPFVPGIKVLDIGAGVGYTMNALLKMGADVYGLEPSGTFYEYAVQHAGIPASRLQKASILDASFENDQFDFINISAVLEHVPDPNSAILTALRWLKKGGFIHISVPSSRWFIAKMINGFYRLTGTGYVTNLSPMHSPFHLYEFDLRSFQQNAKLNHYTVADYEYSVCQTFMPRTLDGIFKKYMHATNTGMEISVWLTK